MTHRRSLQESLAHKAVVEEGEIAVGQKAHFTVDRKTRYAVTETIAVHICQN